MKNVTFVRLAVTDAVQKVTALAVAARYLLRQSPTTFLVVGCTQFSLAVTLCPARILCREHVKCNQLSSQGLSCCCDELGSLPIYRLMLYDFLIVNCSYELNQQDYYRVLISVRSAAALATAKVLTRQWLYINHLSAFLKKKTRAYAYIHSDDTWLIRSSCRTVYKCILG